MSSATNIRAKKPGRIVFLSAAEASGDIHCANLIKVLREKDSGIVFVGIGGERMAQAGCELLENSVSRAAMTYKAFGQAGFFFRLLRRVRAYLRNNPVDLVIVCDSPAFNFHVAKAAKKAGIQTLFYVAPQLWAWAPWRIRKLRRFCNRLACILPFEEDWFTQRGVKAEFVGNPLMDGLVIEQNSTRRYEGFDVADARVALMPGSRQAEIESLWHPMQQIACYLKDKQPGMKFVAVAADQQKLEHLKAEQIEGFDCNYTISRVFESALEADLSLVASGSATLQVAAAGCPMVIMYQSNRLAWQLLGRFLVTSRYLSLVNILAGKELVPEFMPYFRSIEPIREKCEELLSDPDELRHLSSTLVELVKPLATQSAGERVSRLVLDMLRPQ
ncbi:MAG: lipid-A-disaccharide synthase [Planctomycetota bacterium]